MPFIRRPVSLRLPPRRRRAPGGPQRRSPLLMLLACLAIIAGIFCLIILPSNRYLDDVACRTAISHTGSVLTAAVNETVREKMSEPEYSYDYFVIHRHDESGNVTSITTDMARINSLSAEILGEVIEKTESGELDLKIPLGTLLGSSLLLGRGPDMPVKLMVLTTSFASFRNEFEAVGINQSKHQVILELRIEVDIILPWKIESTEIYCEVLIAETIVVGRVPDTYLGISP